MSAPGLNLKTLQVGQVYQFGLIIRQVMTILVAIVLAKSSLSIQAIGQYEQLLLLGYGFTSFWIDSLSRGFLKVYHDLSAGEGSVFTRQANAFLLWITLSTGVLSILILYLLSQVFPGEGFRADLWMIFASYIFLFQLSALTEVVLLVRGKTLQLLVWIFFSVSGLVFGFLLPIWISGKLLTGLYGLILFGLGRFIWYAYECQPFVRIRWASDVLKKWLRLSGPLVVYSLIGGAVILVDGILITYWFNDPSVFAIYRYGARELPFALVIASGLEMTALGRNNLGANYLRGLTKKMLYWSFPVAICLMFGSEWLFSNIFSSNFSNSAIIFKIYLFILVSRFVLTSPLLTARGATKSILYVGIVELGINLCLSFIFVQIWGIEGIAWATVIAFSFEKLAHLFLLEKKWGVPAKEIVPIPLIVLYSILLIICFWVTT
ncbi:MAG: polysaccharide biosynthesis C-terminal domain-containing protein [Saprospiraceae bacterium]|nr:polysaccharide biosynthesis C-terminal domain-containing protein [Saprospiraceae bacterium]